VISGDEDLFLPARLSRVLAERIPGARATVIAGGAHALHVEKPAEFNRAVLEFIGGAA
jgi:pimeloyl-ACP methyl ester carboxylesterase